MKFMSLYQIYSICWAILNISCWRKVYLMSIFLKYKCICMLRSDCDIWQPLLSPIIPSLSLSFSDQLFSSLSYSLTQFLSLTCLLLPIHTRVCMALECCFSMSCICFSQNWSLSSTVFWTSPSTFLCVSSCNNYNRLKNKK